MKTYVSSCPTHFDRTSLNIYQGEKCFERSFQRKIKRTLCPVHFQECLAVLEIMKNELLWYV
jgi:hypothetical protein